MQKKIIFLSFVTFLALLTCMSACSHNTGADSSSKKTVSSRTQKTSSAASKTSSAESSNSESSGSETDKPIGYQLEKPSDGEDIAVFETSMGTVKMRLFPKEAPKAVENFKKLIEKEYYTGLIFHRVINNFMIQTGDPNGDGTGGESIWGGKFKDEFNPNLLNLRGAVAMANSGKDTNGSQFFINQAPVSALSGWDYFQKAYEVYKKSPEAFVSQYGSAWLDMNKVTKEYKSIYEKYGGNPNLDGAYNIDGTGYTVFAQVFDGLDTVDKIAAVKTNESNKPLEPVIIEKAQIEKYKAD